MSTPWPADVIHVNEDGWVLINRGSEHGVFVGMRLLVVGTGIRELHDLFAPDSDSDTQAPALRIRRTYELLEVIYTETGCAIAIATRTPAARRPMVFRGPAQELLVWVPLPEGYSWPPAGETTPPPDVDDTSADGAADDESAEVADEPPEHAPQEDELWEESLPLNSVSVGDIVLPAIPAAPSSRAPATSTTIANATGGTPTDTPPTSQAQAQTHTTPYDEGRTYDWMKKPGE